MSACAPGNELTLVGTIAAADTFVADDPPISVYANLAHHALSCWVGPQGPLKTTYIFEAEVAPVSAGGHAEIVLHDRDTTSPHPWGPSAFRIELTQLGGGTNTQISMLNIKLPPDLAAALRADVIDWAKGGNGCQAQILRPPPAEPVPAAVPVVTPKGKKKKNG